MFLHKISELYERRSHCGIVAATYGMKLIFFLIMHRPSNPLGQTQTSKPVRCSTVTRGGLRPIQR